MFTRFFILFFAEIGKNKTNGRDEFPMRKDEENAA